MVFLEVLVRINRNFTYLYSDKRLGRLPSITGPHPVYEKLKRHRQVCVERGSAHIFYAFCVGRVYARLFFD